MSIHFQLIPYTDQKRRLSLKILPLFQLNTHREWRALQVCIDIFIHIKHCCPIKKPMCLVCVCKYCLLLLHIISMTCWYSSWCCGKLAIFHLTQGIIILLPFWLAEFMPDNFCVRLGDLANLWKAKHCTHNEGQAIRGQLMSSGRFMHFGLHPSTNMIMAGKNPHWSTACASF